MAIFPGAVSTDSDLYIAVNQTTTQLTDNPLTIGATTVNVVSATAFPTVGFISIDAEIIKYTGKTATSFTGCTRGADGTTAASHVQNSQVYHNVIAAHHNVLKDEIKAIEQFISDQVGLSTTQIKGPNGTVSLPGHSFAADTDSGLYRIGANDIALAVNGAIALEVDTTAVYFYSGGTSTYEANSSRFRPATDNTKELGSSTQGWSHVYASGGTAALPGYTFSGDSDTGIFLAAANAISLTTAGVERLDIASGGMEVYVTSRFSDGTVSLPGIAFINDSDCGLYRIGTNNIALGTNGIRALEITSAQAVKIKGTATNDNATTGDVGEFIESTIAFASRVSSTGTGQWTDLTSVSLTAGDWDVWITISLTANGASVTQEQTGFSTTSGNSAAGLTFGDNAFIPENPTGAAGTEDSTVSFYKRISLSTTTTHYAKFFMAHTVATPQAYGNIRARRVR